MIVTIVLYLFIIFVVYVAVMQYIDYTVCDCKPCGFFTELDNMTGTVEDKIQFLLRPMIFPNIWPCCIIAAVIVTFVFSWLYPLLTLVPYSYNYYYLYNQGFLFAITFLITFGLFSFIQETYLSALTPLFLEAYHKHIEIKNNDIING